MPQKLVTLARFSNPVEAALARNRLEEAGVRAVLNGEASSLLGLQNISSGNIELLVPEQEIETAREALRYKDLSLGQIQQRTAERHPDGIINQAELVAPQTDITTPDQLEDGETEPDPVAETIDRAFRATVLSFFVFPLTLYASYLLLGLFLNQSRIPSRSWGKLLCAVLVSTPFTLVVLGVASWIIRELLQPLLPI